MQQLDHYYASELQYLTDAGREFARAHPQQAALLNPDNVQARDPHVERLFENFAFLAANIRARLDDDIPELSQSLLGLLCPHYTRAVPALATVQLLPDFTQLTGVVRVEADSSVKSNPMMVSAATEQLSCSFRTCYPVDLYPLELTSARMCGPLQGCDGIEMVFELRGTAKWEQLQLDRIRLHLRGESHQLIYSLYYHLMHRVARVEWEFAGVSRAAGLPVRGTGGSRCTSGPVGTPAGIEPVGFGRCEQVIPYDTQSFPGFRLVHEYFCFPEKFFYVDLCGFADRLASVSGNAIAVRIWFQGEAPAWWNLSKENFHQFCTPAINLFSEHAFPIDFDQRVSEYPIYVDKSLPDGYQVHSVKAVVGRPTGQSTADPRAYCSFLDFRAPHARAAGRTGSAGEQAYYHVRSHHRTEGELECTLSLVTPEGSAAVLPEQVLAVDVEAFNGDYPSRLRPGDICFRGEDMPHLVASVRNFSSPTRVRWPVTGGAQTWHFISHLALNHLSLLDAPERGYESASGGALSGVLQLYDWTGEPANARRLSGLTAVTIRDQRAVIVRQGTVVQGMEVRVDIDESCFTDIGDAYLFGQVLRHFLALYATINSFVRLRVQCTKSNEEWQWPALDGRQMMI